ncbi:MAG: type II toxin-antitoxin system HicB family antitoxin [Dehalococcoidales bacterium]|nr:type II toxin-antitoxin system HicB family antitoxin [Dehalococcoidales bacterium]
MEYTVVIRKAPDGYFIASCPVIPEARAQGKTYAECMANIKETIRLCLEYRKELDEEIPSETQTEKVSVAL